MAKLIERMVNAERVEDLISVFGSFDLADESVYNRYVSFGTVSDSPGWLDVDAENLKGTVKELPAREDIDVPVDEMLIVELYSR